MSLRLRLILAFLAVGLPFALGAVAVLQFADAQIRARRNASLSAVVGGIRGALRRESARIDAELGRLTQGRQRPALYRSAELWPAFADRPDQTPSPEVDLDVLWGVDVAAGPEGLVFMAPHLPAAIGFPPTTPIGRTSTTGFAAEWILPPAAPVSRTSTTGREAAWLRGTPRVVPALVGTRALDGRLLLRGGRRLDRPWLDEIGRQAGARLELFGPDLDAPLVFGASLSGPAAGRRIVEIPSIDGGPPATLEIAVGPSPWAPLRDDVWEWSLIALASAFVIAALAALGLSRQLGAPIAALSSAARRVEGGDLSARVPARGLDEVGELGRAFNDMVEELARARGRIARAERLAAWREVARRVAHEVKNPLSPIRMAAENARKSVRMKHPKAAEIVERSTEAVLTEVESIDRLVSEFAEFARLPPPRFESVQWQPLLQRAVERIAPGFPNVEWFVEAGVANSRVDADLVNRALANLMKNAGEALDGRPGAVELATRAVPGGIELSVTDDGPGLPHDAHRAFLPYATTKPHGTGLGLAVVEHVAREHGGDVRHEPAHPHGARFVLSIPDRGPEEPPT